MNLVKRAYQKFRGKRLPLLLVILLLGGSVLTFYFYFIRPRSALRSCRFQFVSLSVHSYNDEAVVFKLLMNVSNPDWQSAQLDPMSFDVVPHGFTEPMAHGWTEEAYSIPSYGSSIVTFFLQVHDSPMLCSVLTNFLDLGRAEFTASGFMTCTWLMNLRIPFTFNYALEMRRGLLGMVELVAIEALPPGTRFNVTLRVDNPLGVSFNVSSLVFDVFNESRTWLLKGCLPSPLRIPPSGWVNASFLIDVGKTEFEWLMGRLMSKEDVKLWVYGNVSAGAYALRCASLNFNLSKIFRLPWEMEVRLNQTLLGPIERGLDSVAFKVPIEVKSPIECNASFIHFELYDRLSSYVGFGYASYEPPLLLSAHQKTWLPISINMTLPAFRSLVTQFMLGEPVNLQIRNGVMSISIYQTTYNIHFERKNQIIRS